MADDKPVILPPWVRDAGKYLGIVAPMIFGVWLAFHDLQQDFVLEQGKSEELADRVVNLDKVSERLEKQLLEAD